MSVFLSVAKRTHKNCMLQKSKLSDDHRLASWVVNQVDESFNPRPSVGVQNYMQRTTGGYTTQSDVRKNDDAAGACVASVKDLNFKIRTHRSYCLSWWPRAMQNVAAFDCWMLIITGSYNPSINGRTGIISARQADYNSRHVCLRHIRAHTIKLKHMARATDRSTLSLCCVDQWKLH